MEGSKDDLNYIYCPTNESFWGTISFENNEICKLQWIHITEGGYDAEDVINIGDNSTEEVRIYDCLIYDCCDTGVGLNIVSASEVNIIHVYISSFDIGAIIAGADVLFYSCTVEDCRLYGVSLGDCGLLMKNCMITDSNIGLRMVEESLYQVEIWNCLFKDNTEEGILWESTTSADDSYVNMYFCTFAENGTGCSFDAVFNDEEDFSDCVLNSRIIAGDDQLGFCNHIFWENDVSLAVGEFWDSNEVDVLYCASKITPGGDHITGDFDFGDNCIFFEDDWFEIVDEIQIFEAPNYLAHFSLLRAFPDDDPTGSINHCINAAADEDVFDDYGDPATRGDFGWTGGPSGKFYRGYWGSSVYNNDYIILPPDVNGNYALPAFENYLIPEDFRVFTGSSLSVTSSTIEVDREANFVINGDLNIDGSSIYPSVVQCYQPFEDSTFTMFGIKFSSASYETEIKHTYFLNAEKGLHLVNSGGTGSERILVENCNFDSCGYGLYINNSRVEVTNTTITNSDDGYYGNAIYMSNCSSGKVILDNCEITDNGVGSDYNSAAVYLYSSDPEIINCTIEDNTGGGIACIGSNPDLDTYDSGGNQINNIHANGSATQSGYSGAEIYLASSSYPSIKYNNIWDYDTGPIGVMIYKDETTNSSTAYATNNWWGCSAPADTFFSWGLGSAIDYSSYSSSQLSSLEDYETALSYWNDGDYVNAARYFRLSAYDPGSVGINSIHYLTGCANEMENGDLDDLRDFFIDVAVDHEDETVAKIADRFATHCLTEMGEFEDALNEYDLTRLNADCLLDSVMAVIDWLAVSELADGGNEINARGQSISQQMKELLQSFNDRSQQTDPAIYPETFTIVEAYPNPFNSSTTIRYNLSETLPVNLRIFDLQGRQVEHLIDQRQQPGVHTATWSALNTPTGIYFCCLGAGSEVRSIKLTVVK